MNIQEIIKRELDNYRPLKVSDWVNKYRVLKESSAGKWDITLTPYLEKIMDSFSDHSVREITILSSTQVGKTESIFNMIAYSIDADPGPTLFVMPTENEVKKITKARVMPMIENTPALSNQLKSKQDKTNTRFHFSGGSNLFFGWSNSPTSLASMAIRYLFMDEIDKYPHRAEKEASPIKLARERTRTYPDDKKIIKTSTPTTLRGYIYQEFNASQRYYYYVSCPFCKKKFKFEFNYLKKDKYQCHHCKKLINNKQKKPMIAKGGWETKDPKNDNISFFLNCFYSPWIKFEDIHREYERSKNNHSNLMNFINSWLAEPYDDIIDETKIETLKALRRNYKMKDVPSGVGFLTGGVDVQKDSFYFVIRGWGDNGFSWLIDAREVDSWSDIEFFMTKTYGELPVHQVFVDSGYNALQVYKLCRKNPYFYFPCKGSKNIAGGIPLRRKEMDCLILYHVNTCYFKDQLKFHISNHKEYGSRFLLPCDIHERYLKQMVSEQKVVNKAGTGYEWQAKNPHNHWFDCEVYAAACAYQNKSFLLLRE